MKNSQSVARRYLALFVTLRGRLILLVCFATVPALLFIFYVAARERESTMKRMETEALQLGGLASREHAQQLRGAKNLLLRLREPLACNGNGVTASVDLQWLDRLAQQAKLPPDYALLITDRAGRILARSGNVEAATPGGRLRPPSPRRPDLLPAEVQDRHRHTGRSRPVRQTHRAKRAHGTALHPRL